MKLQNNKNIIFRSYKPEASEMKKKIIFRLRKPGFRTQKFKISQSSFKRGRWDQDEHKKFIDACMTFGNNWRKVRFSI